MGVFNSFHGFPETRPFDEEAREMVAVDMIPKSHDHFTAPMLLSTASILANSRTLHIVYVWAR